MGGDIAFANPCPQHPGLAACGDGGREIIVGIEHHEALLRHGLGESAFLQRDGFARAHVFDVGDTDVRDDSRIGRGDGGQRSDLAGMVHAHFKHAAGVALAQLQNAQWQTNVIVKIALGGADLVLGGHHTAGQILGRRLAIRTGDAEDKGLVPGTIVACQLLEAGEGVGDMDHGAGQGVPALRQPANHHGGGSGFRDLAQEVVAVELLTLQGDEEIARGDVARVRGDAGDETAAVTAEELAFAEMGDGDEVEFLHRRPPPLSRSSRGQPPPCCSRSSRSR